MGSLKSTAYDYIKNCIITSEYMANAVIDEKEIMQKLGISRTPVREAIIALSQEGYVNIIPKCGVFVSPFTYHDVLAVFEVRALLEPWLIKTYGPRVSQEELLLEKELILSENMEIPDKPGISMSHRPHMLFMSKCNNRYINDMLKFVEEQNKRMPNNGAQPDDMDAASSQMHYQDNIVETHMKLVDLLLAGDVDQAVEEMHAHVALAKKIYLSYWFGNR